MTGLWTGLNSLPFPVWYGSCHSETSKGRRMSIAAARRSQIRIGPAGSEMMSRKTMGPVVMFLGLLLLSPGTADAEKRHVRRHVSTAPGGVSTARFYNSPVRRRGVGTMRAYGARRRVVSRPVVYQHVTVTRSHICRPVPVVTSGVPAYYVPRRGFGFAINRPGFSFGFSRIGGGTGISLGIFR